MDVHNKKVVPNMHHLQAIHPSTIQLFWCELLSIAGADLFGAP